MTGARQKRVSRASRTNHKRSHKGAGKSSRALPALSSLQALPTWADLTPTEGQQQAFQKAANTLSEREGADPTEYELGCVVRLDRSFPAILTEQRLCRAEFSAALTKWGDSKVAVGDWVCLRVPVQYEEMLIEEILPRKSALERWRGGSRGEKQVLAANVDLVLVVQAIGPHGIDYNRLVRSCVIARDCGCDATIILTKADRCKSEQELAAIVRKVITLVGGDTPICVTTTKTAGLEEPLHHLEDKFKVGIGSQAVENLVGRGTVALVLGESGVGKSTLLNSLMGHDVLKTGSVRRSDDAGRHTTVARQMVRLPTGAIIIDMPGLRTLPLVGHERGLAKVFPDIAAYAAQCRFRDCAHTTEPGCAVKRALDEGKFACARYEAYVALAQEMRDSAQSLDPDVTL